MPASRLQGLSDAEVLARRREFGENVLPGKSDPSWFSVWVDRQTLAIILLLS